MVGPPPPPEISAPPLESLEFEAVFRAWAPYVLRVLRRMGVAARDVEDVAQEVFVGVHRALPSFEGRSSVKTWIYGICIRTCGNYRRRAHRRREELVGEDIQTCEPNTPERELENARALAVLDAALAQLSTAQRAVFVLHEIEQLTVLEIAAALDCSKFTVYARLYAARSAVHAHVKTQAKEWQP